MLEPALEARDNPGVIGTTAGGVISHSTQVDALPVRQATDHGDEGVEMAFAVAGWTGGTNCMSPCFMAA